MFAKNSTFQGFSVLSRRNALRKYFVKFKWNEIMNKINEYYQN